MYHKYADVHTLLKEHTGEIHNQLHHVPIFRKISTGNFTREDYYDYLAINHCFYKNLESHFETVNFIRFANEISFTPWIEQDIGSRETVCEQNVLCFSDLAKDFSTYIGFAYVKYGSMTGSQVLLSKIAKTNRVHVNNLNFLTQSVSNRNLIWPRFLQFMQNHRDTIEIDDAIASAKFCFNLMYQYAAEIELEGQIHVAIRSK